MNVNPAINTNSHYYMDMIATSQESDNGDSKFKKVGQDTLQLSVRELDKAEICDTYENLRAQIKEMPIPYQNKLFSETYDIMKDYYDGKIGKEEIKEKLQNYLKQMIGMPQCCNNSFMKQRTEKVLATLYEHFSRSNSRNACAKNQQEQINYMKKSGIKGTDLDTYSVLKGTIYYNADYYYACEDMQKFLKDVLDELAEEYGASKVDYDYVEKNTKFTLDGGLSYNGVWNHHQYQTNHYWMKGAQGVSSIIDNGFVPPRGLIYCYTGCISKENVKRVEDFMRDERQGESNYNPEVNGKKISLLMFLKYGDSVINDWNRIEQELEKRKIHFLTPQSMGYHSNYFEMLRLKEVV